MTESTALTVTEQREITPQVWGMIEAIVQTTSVSQIERAKIAQKMLFAFENGLPLNLAFNGGLYSVNNRVEVEGNVIRAQLRKHPHYDYEIAELNEKKCTMVITHDGKPVGETTFTIEDAKKIIDSKTNKSLAEKDNWKNYPADMLLNRATSRAYKRYAPDIFFTPVYVRGEIEGNDVPDDDVIEGEIVVSNTLDSLINKYGAETVFAANDNQTPDPHNVEQVKRIAARLQERESVE